MPSSRWVDRSRPAGTSKGPADAGPFSVCRKWRRFSPACRNHVWSCGFVRRRTDDGRAFRTLDIPVDVGCPDRGLLVRSHCPKTTSRPRSHFSPRQNIRRRCASWILFSNASPMIPGCGRRGSAVVAHRMDENVLVVPLDGIGKAAFYGRSEGNPARLRIRPVRRERTSNNAGFWPARRGGRAAPPGGTSGTSRRRTEARGYPRPPRRGRRASAVASPFRRTRGKNRPQTLRALCSGSRV